MFKHALTVFACIAASADALRISSDLQAETEGLFRDGIIISSDSDPQAKSEVPAGSLTISSDPQAPALGAPSDPQAKTT